MATSNEMSVFSRYRRWVLYTWYYTSVISRKGDAIQKKGNCEKKWNHGNVVNNLHELTALFYSLFQVATALFHTVAVMSSNDIVGCGQNDEGQVRPDSSGEGFFPRPSSIRPVLCQRVTQASSSRPSVDKDIAGETDINARCWEAGWTYGLVG